MPVYGDDPLTELDEGAESGDTITFTVDDQPAVPLGPDPPVWVGAGELVHVELEVCPLFGDLDCDCDVDVADVMMVASRYGAANLGISAMIRSATSMTVATLTSWTLCW
jgi:hypothetical protein